MPELAERLAEFAKQGEQPQLTLRSLLAAFGQARRGAIVNRRIAEKLAEMNLRTEPDFRSAYPDEMLTFVPADAPVVESGSNPSDVEPATPDSGVTAGAGPEQIQIEVAHASQAVRRDGSSYRVRRFVSENKRTRGLISVPPSATVEHAVTLMLYYDFSQLPVMANEKSLQGVVSWRTIGQAYALGQTPSSVSECMVLPDTVDEQDPIFRLIALVQQNDVAVVRGEGRKYITLFTAADLGDLYRDLSEAFILLGEIEDHLRALLDRASFTPDELNAARGPGDSGTVHRVDDLSFGSYIVLISDEANWSRLQLRVDRAWFVRELDEIRELRNAVMHFDPDGLTADETAQLSRFCGLLRTLRHSAPRTT